MLDRVIDSNNVVSTYTYAQEKNAYRSLMGSTNEARWYAMGANLTEIDYGYAASLVPTSNYTDKVVLTYVGRCNTDATVVDPIRNGASTCPTIAANPSDYPDVPVDEICGDPTGPGGCLTNPIYEPTYFSTKMLWNIATSTLDTSGNPSGVMEYQFKHDLFNPPGAITNFMWLAYIQRMDFSSRYATEANLPVISFVASSLQNLVGGTGSTDLRFARVIGINNDLGGYTSIAYGLPNACTTTTLPSESDNHKDCYKQQWVPDGTTTQQTKWFNKYMVTEVDDHPVVGDSVQRVETTTYTYPGTAAWRWPDSVLEQVKDASWTTWAGYSSAVVTVANGGGWEQHSTQYWMLQGIDGDRSNTSDTATKSVTVTGASGGPSLSLVDSRWLADRVYEQATTDFAGLTQSYVVNTYGFVQTTATYSGMYSARMVRQTNAETYQLTSAATYTDMSTWRYFFTSDIYDTSQVASADFGLPVAVLDAPHGRALVTDRNWYVINQACTAYTYVYNKAPASDRWMIKTQTTAHYAEGCATPYVYQDGQTTTLYDNHAINAAPLYGNPTQVSTYTDTDVTHAKVVKHAYDLGGRVTSDTDGDNNTTMTSYSPVNSWPGTVTVTTPVPDLTIQDPYGQSSSKTALTTTTVLDPATGEPTKVTDANGNVTGTAYDNSGRLVKVWKANTTIGADASTTYSYNTPTTGATLSGSAIPDSVTGPTVVATGTLRGLTPRPAYTYTYSYLDGLGRTNEVQTAAADGSSNRSVVLYEYDDAGNKVGTSDPFEGSGTAGSGLLDPDPATVPAVRYALVDWAGRPLQSSIMVDGSLAGAEVGHFSYSEDQTFATDPDNHTTTTNIDVKGRTTSIVQSTPDLSPTSITTSYQYDDLGRLTQITDAGGAVTTYAYDWAGQRIGAHDPDSGNSCMYYDNAGNIKATAATAPTTCPLDPTGLSQLVTTLYDALNRPTSTWSGAAGTGLKLTWNTYDTAAQGLGLPTSSTSYTASGAAYLNTVDGYDVDGNVLGNTVTIPGVEGSLAGNYDTTETYNLNDQPTTATYPAVGTSTGSTTLPLETISTGYTALGQPSTLTSSLATYVSATGYWPTGQLLSRTYGTGSLTATRHYTWDDTTSLLKEITTSVSNSGTNAQDDKYGYDQTRAASFNPAHKLIDQCVEASVGHRVADEEEAKRTAVDLFRRLRLPDAENFGLRYPHQVSGGQLQRAMTAMAMATRPDLIIFDEPTTALDVTTQIEVLAAIKNIVRQFQTAAIYISHDLAVVAQMADRVMVLRYGELVEEATTREMLSNPQQAYTKSLWAVRSLRKEEEAGKETLLRVDAVDAAYGHLKVLHGVSIAVPRGRTVAVVGESGSGKSTLARVITGLLPPIAGRWRSPGSWAAPPGWAARVEMRGLMGTRRYRWVGASEQRGDPCSANSPP